MSRSVTVLLGVVPATYLLFLAVVVFAVFTLTSPSETVRAQPAGFALLVLITLAAIAGYVALVCTLWRRTTAWLIGGLVAGLSANFYAIAVLLDVGPRNLQSWHGLYFFVAPALVALAHIVGYVYAQRQLQLADPHAE